ncbi:alpha/beta hydrolase [Alistipes indistinctus]|uniref:alpha/beta hydrolase n=1 Tax=Alistipes indistinctus TaxID=626932 RepID=UPI003522C0AF
MAVLIAPGGGYSFLAINHEGKEIAQWLAGNGITGVVLKYRIPNGHHAIPLADAQQGMRLIRENSAKWKNRPEFGRSHGLFGRRTPRIHTAHSFRCSNTSRLRGFFSIR